MSNDSEYCATAKLALAWKRFFSPSNRYLSPLLISCVLLVGQLSYGVLESYTRHLLAIATSLIAELISRPASTWASGRTWRVPISPASVWASWCARLLSGPTLCVALISIIVEVRAPRSRPAYLESI